MRTDVGPPWTATRVTPIDAAPGGPRAEGPGADLPLGGGNEPTLVVSPTDPDVLAMASLVIPYALPSVGMLRCSTDRGSTWSAPLAATAPPPYNVIGGDPVLAFDREGFLYWSYLGTYYDTSWVFQATDLLVVQVDPQTGTVVGGPHTITDAAGAGQNVANDKQWIALDAHPGSPYRGRLYVVWTLYDQTNASQIWFKSSDDGGASWSAGVALSTLDGPGSDDEGLVAMAHVAVARNGDVYVAYHSQPGFIPGGEGKGTPDGTSGQVFVLRSTDGGASFAQKLAAFPAGTADISFNVQSAAGTLAGADFWTIGSTQAWVVPDPVDPARVLVVACDDPDDVHGAGDDADVVAVRSTDSGQTWTAPAALEAGPGGSFQLFPTASADPLTGAVTVAWYDNRAGLLNAAGNFLLDVFEAVSLDGGQTWTTSGPVNDVPFDPNLGAPQRYPGPPATYRIGEYIGVALAHGSRHAVWCGNTATGQQALYEHAPGSVPAPVWSDLGQALAGTLGEPTLLGLGPALPSAPYALSLVDAAPASVATLVLGLSAIGVPFKQGVLVPAPDWLFPVPTGGGAIELSSTWTGIPAGVPLYAQWWIVDPAGPVGLAASNGVAATTP